jgi:Ulp1 family protease
MRTLQGYPVAKSPSGDDLYQRDIATCIKPLAWLNDEIINAYLTVLVQYLRHSTGNTAPNERPKFHAFNTFFYSTLRDKGYQGVRRWANRAKIGGEALLDVDTVFIPVHQASHWTLIVVRPMDRTIEYFDSLGARGVREVEVIKKWLHGELGDKFDPEEWTFLPSVSSQQDNMSDCGVFLLVNAKAIALGIEPTAFGASDTVDLRMKIVAELMNGGLHGPFCPVDKMGQTLL